MGSVGIWVGMSLLPFLVLIAMADLGVYIFKHRLIAVIIMVAYASSLGYLYLSWGENPLNEALYWCCIGFMAFTLYLGWDVGKRQIQKKVS